MPEKSYIYAISTIIGTSIGAGVFSLPYVASKSGFALFFILIIILGFITLVLNLMYSEITLRTREKSRLVGYCGKYLGESGKKVATLTTLFALYSSILAYIIIGGKFLNAIFYPYLGGSEFIYGIAIGLIISAGIYISLRLVNVVELLMVFFLFLTVLGIIYKGSFFVNLENLMTSNVSQSFFPFGAILFSLSALSAIPELEHIIKKKQQRIKSSIIAGSAITIIVYIFFTAVVLGVTGAKTSEEALRGLELFMGNGIVTIGLIFGVFAIATSFLIVGINLKEVFWYDYHLSEKKSWALACFVPLALFFLGLRDFIAVVSIAGSVIGGLAGILIIIVFYKAKKAGDLTPPFEIKVPLILSSFMIFVFLLGILYEIVYMA